MSGLFHFFSFQYYSMDFPQYRKMDGFQRFYRITGEKHFTEVYLLNGQRVTHEVTAVQYPEMLRIQDMLNRSFSFTDMTEEEIGNVFRD